MTLVNIFYTSFEHPLPQSLFSDYLSLLPADLQGRNSRYIHWQNRHAHLFGRLLLIEALKAHGVETDIWKYVAYNSSQRPYLTLQEFDFNISHSGNFVICAIGKNTRLGIDIEQNKAIDFKNFSDVMTPRQWHKIKNANYPLKEFYNYWTIKESVIKADGRGFSIPLDKLEMKNDTVQYENKLWFVQEIPFDRGYSMALATDRLARFTIHNIDFYKPRRALLYLRAK